ncbi:MGMT family protein [Ammoniphilus sp. 3BR4]|uniref:MGMT family protein n=1 Tax=Ammoniphilus sp. 3BR4 TaxID=3158265 RepID=UPI003466CEAD
MKPFTERTISIIKSIPAGKVMTYGQVASLAGSPRGARQVVRILHSMSHNHQLPWHRIIHSSGEINTSNRELYREQKQLLEMENIRFINDCRIDLDLYQYHPQE